MEIHRKMKKKLNIIFCLVMIEAQVLEKKIWSIFRRRRGAVIVQHRRQLDVAREGENASQPGERPAGK